ncbi:hypothetical protein C8D87_11411 [Lentzea atacamensis]|uniref:Uncharacterized protein n=1 Tax=Lentzea atacamensis TaxID=531938 RepID=A0ABX9DVU3_9PSEU|nr:hypothetical protein [Lentzea atacamensis]RAS59399.1 hypothetical protein C8D87_11411 [Lentzea atacamensis]
MDAQTVPGTDLPALGALARQGSAAPSSAPAATNLSDAVLAGLRERARREAGPFIDPVVLRQLEGKLARAHPEWLSAVIGRPVHGWRSLGWTELVLLGLARDAEPDPPVPPRVLAEREREALQERCRAERLEQQAEAWASLRAALPVRVSVAYNGSGRHHYAAYVSGAEHIVVREPLRTGRLRRDANRSLCWTPSRAPHLLFENLDIPNDRIPTCKACLRTAERIAHPHPAGQTRGTEKNTGERTAAVSASILALELPTDLPADSVVGGAK